MSVMVRDYKKDPVKIELGQLVVIKGAVFRVIRTSDRPVEIVLELATETQIQNFRDQNGGREPKEDVIPPAGNEAKAPGQQAQGGQLTSKEPPKMPGAIKKGPSGENKGRPEGAQTFANDNSDSDNGKG